MRRWDLQREADPSKGAQKVRPWQCAGPDWPEAAAHPACHKPSQLLLLLFKFGPAMDKTASMSRMVGFFFFLKEEALEWPSHPGTVSRGGPGPEKGQEGPFYEPLPLHIPPLSCTSAFPRGRGFEREETGIVTWTKLLKKKTNLAVFHLEAFSRSQEGQGAEVPGRAGGRGPELHPALSADAPFAPRGPGWPSPFPGSTDATRWVGRADPRPFHGPLALLFPPAVPLPCLGAGDSHPPADPTERETGFAHPGPSSWP